VKSGVDARTSGALRRRAGVPPAPLGDGRGEVPLRGFRGEPQAVKLAPAWRGPGRQPRSGGMTWDLASIRTLVETPAGAPVHDLIRMSIHWKVWDAAILLTHFSDRVRAAHGPQSSQGRVPASLRSCPKVVCGRGFAAVPDLSNLPCLPHGIVMLEKSSDEARAQAASRRGL
jgi:hypothetical protein